MSLAKTCELNTLTMHVYKIYQHIFPSAALRTNLNIKKKYFLIFKKKCKVVNIVTMVCLKLQIYELKS